MGMIKLVYTNELGGSLVFSRDSEVHITDISGLSENSISLSESKVLNGVGTSNTGYDISSKTITITGQFAPDPEIRRRMLDVVLPGVNATLRYIDGETDVFWDVQPTSTPTIGWSEFVQNFQFSVKAFYPYARTFATFRETFLEQNASELLPIDFPSGEGFVIGTVANKKKVEVYNNGLETGLLIKIKPLIEDLTRFQMYDAVSTASIDLNGLEGIKTTDIIEISTEPNNTYCHLVNADGTVKNLIKYLKFTTKLPMLHRGLNTYTVRMNNDVQGKWISGEATIEYRKVYAGV